MLLTSPLPRARRSPSPCTFLRYVFMFETDYGAPLPRILVEFVADLYPEAGILPSDPVQRAKARFFIDAVNNKFANKYAAHVVNGAPAADLISGAEFIQSLLPTDKKYAVGDELSAADIAIIPFVLRGEIVFSLKDTENVWGTLKGEKFTRLFKYFDDLKAHPAVASTWDEKTVREAYTKRFSAQK